MSDQPEPDLGKLMSRMGAYSPHAIQFVRDGLAHTVKVIHGDGERAEEDSRHITGQQLCLGLKDYAIRQYGRLAKTVLNHWGVRTTDDFGKIVFAMVEAGFMRKTEEDSLEDFRAVFDFDEAFGDLAASR